MYYVRYLYFCIINLTPNYHLNKIIFKRQFRYPQYFMHYKKLYVVPKCLVKLLYSSLQKKKNPFVFAFWHLQLANVFKLIVVLLGNQTNNNKISLAYFFQSCSQETFPFCRIFFGTEIVGNFTRKASIHIYIKWNTTFLAGITSKRHCYPIKKTQK